MLNEYISGAPMLVCNIRLVHAPYTRIWFLLTWDSYLHQETGKKVLFVRFSKPKKHRNQ